ncbi:MAG: hypothetical protein H7Z13_09185 [Ferruginibacter sp.]|nr:hypothetical protein [Ferruginibacter sp.]
METIIKVNPSELNMGFLDKIKTFIGNRNNIDVTISLKEFDIGYAEALDHSIEEAENEQHLVTFSMEDFMAYTPVK